MVPLNEFVCEETTINVNLSFVVNGGEENIFLLQMEQ
jgi:hypothetical protein